MQHTIDPAGHYKRIDIRKPRFQRAPAAPAVIPKVPGLAGIMIMCIAWASLLRMTMQWSALGQQLQTLCVY